MCAIIKIIMEKILMFNFLYGYVSNNKIVCFLNLIIKKHIYN